MSDEWQTNGRYRPHKVYMYKLSFNVRGLQVTPISCHTPLLRDDYVITSPHCLNENGLLIRHVRRRSRTAKGAATHSNTWPATLRCLCQTTKKSWTLDLHIFISAEILVRLSNNGGMVSGQIVRVSFVVACARPLHSKKKTDIQRIKGWLSGVLLHS